MVWNIWSDCESPITVIFRLVVRCYNEFQSCCSGLSQSFFFCFRVLENWIHKPLSWRGNWRSKETSCWHRSSRAFCPQTQSFKYFCKTRCWLKLKKRDPLDILIIPVLYNYDSLMHELLFCCANTFLNSSGLVLKHSLKFFYSDNVIEFRIILGHFCTNFQLNVFKESILPTNFFSIYPQWRLFLLCSSFLYLYKIYIFIVINWCVLFCFLMLKIFSMVIA